MVLEVGWSESINYVDAEGTIACLDNLCCRGEPTLPSPTTKLVKKGLKHTEQVLEPATSILHVCDFISPMPFTLRCMMSKHIK